MYRNTCYKRSCSTGLGGLSRSWGLAAFLRARGLGDVSSIQSQIVASADSAGIPPSIALAVAQIESSFNPAAVSPVGAIGVMQLMPGTASSLGVDPTDAGQNIQGGVTYLAQLYQQFGNWAAALAAYNAGPTGSVSGSPATIAAGQTYAQTVLNAQPTYLGFDPSPSDGGGLTQVAGDFDVLPDSLDLSGDLTPVLVLGALGAAVLLYSFS